MHRVHRADQVHRVHRVRRVPDPSYPACKPFEYVLPTRPDPDEHFPMNFAAGEHIYLFDLQRAIERHMRRIAENGGRCFSRSQNICTAYDFAWTVRGKLLRQRAIRRKAKSIYVVLKSFKITWMPDIYASLPPYDPSTFYSIAPLEITEITWNS